MSLASVNLRLMHNILGDSCINLISTENSTAGIPNNSSIAYFQFRLNNSISQGEITSPTPKQVSKRAGPNF
jgi:hypothetical protein